MTKSKVSDAQLRVLVLNTYSLYQRAKAFSRALIPFGGDMEMYAKLPEFVRQNRQELVDIHTHGEGVRYTLQFKNDGRWLPFGGVYRSRREARVQILLNDGLYGPQRVVVLKGAPGKNGQEGPADVPGQNPRG